jgi:Transcriptional regulator, effector-binding domain/component
MRVQWIVLIVVGVAVAVGLVVYFSTRKGPDLSGYLPLKEPRIVSREDERVLEVAFSGPADKVIPEAYSVLFKAYYRMKGSPKGAAMKCPKARYVLPAEGDPEAEAKLKDFTAHEWRGSVAIPIPAGLAVPAQKLSAGGMVATEGRWAYGEVAEILHLGSYETEGPTIDRLTSLIASRGYEMIGEHEEEYLKGPGMGKVDPKDYWTIIRFRLRKAK